MIVSHLIEAVLISILGLLLRWENKKRDRIQSQMEGGLEGRDLDSTAFLDLTDRENLKYVLGGCDPLPRVIISNTASASGIFTKSTTHYHIVLRRLRTINTFQVLSHSRGLLRSNPSAPFRDFAISLLAIHGSLFSLPVSISRSFFLFRHSYLLWCAQSSSAYQAPGIDGLIELPPLQIAGETFRLGDLNTLAQHETVS